MELKGVQHPTFANEGRARKRISDVNIRKRKNNKKRNTTPYYNLSSRHTCLVVRWNNKSTYGS